MYIQYNKELGRAAIHKAVTSLHFPPMDSNFSKQNANIRVKIIWGRRNETGVVKRNYYFLGESNQIVIKTKTDSYRTKQCKTSID